MERQRAAHRLRGAGHLNIFTQSQSIRPWSIRLLSIRLCSIPLQSIRLRLIYQQPIH